MYNIKIDLPNLDKGAEIEIDGLGVFENGSVVQIEDERADAFCAKHTRYEHSFDEEGHLIVVPEIPSFEEVVETINGVTTSKVGSTAPVVTNSQGAAASKKDDKTEGAAAAKDKGSAPQEGDEH